MLLILAIATIGGAVYYLAEVATEPMRTRRNLVHRAANYGLTRTITGKELPRFRERVLGPFISQVARLEQIPEAERLNPERVVSAIAEAGRLAFYERNADAIVDRIIPMLQPKDVVVVFSNGGFDNIHEKLLARLRKS